MRLALAQVPSIEGHLTDPGKQLSEREKARIEYLLEAVATDTQTDVAFFIIAQPVKSMRDTAAECFRVWKIGVNRPGGGLLVVIDPSLQECVALADNNSASFGANDIGKLEELVRESLRRKQIFSGLIAAIDFVRKSRLGTTPEKLTPAVEGNPPVPGIESHVTDPAAALLEADRISLDRQLANLQTDADADVAIFISPRPVASLVAMGKAAFQTWSIGKQWDRGGLLLIVSHDLRDCALILPEAESPLAPTAAAEIEKDLRKRLLEAKLTEGLNFAVGRIRNLLLKDRPKRSQKNALPGIESHITDPARLLSESERKSLDQALTDIQQLSKVDVVVYLSDDPDAALQELGPTCFNGWGVGRSWQGGGLLLVVTPSLQDCIVVTTDPQTPISRKVADEFEKVLRTRLKSKLPLDQTLNYAVSKVQRLIEASGKRPKVYPPFLPNREGAKRYATMALLIFGMALASERWRTRKRAEPTEAVDA